MIKVLPQPIVNKLSRTMCSVLRTKPYMSSVLRSLANCARRVMDCRMPSEWHQLLLTAHWVMMTVCHGALLHGTPKSPVPALIPATAKLLYWKPKCDIIPHCANVGCDLVVVNGRTLSWIVWCRFCHFNAIWCQAVFLMVIPIICDHWALFVHACTACSQHTVQDWDKLFFFSIPAFSIPSCPLSLSFCFPFPPSFFMGSASFNPAGECCEQILVHFEFEREHTCSFFSQRTEDKITMLMNNDIGLTCQ